MAVANTCMWVQFLEVGCGVECMHISLLFSV